MRYAKAFILMAVMGFSFTLAFAAGSASEGKKLFNDPSLSGSANEMACNTCHPGGKGIEHAGAKDYANAGGGASSLEEMVNICITNPLKGKALAQDSKQMLDMVAYIKSLGSKQ